MTGAPPTERRGCQSCLGDADKLAADWLMRPRGAYVMGRNMFGPVRGDWDED